MKHRSFKSNSFKKRATAALVSALKSIGSDGLNPVNADVLCANTIADAIQNLDGVDELIVELLSNDIINERDRIAVTTPDFSSVTFMSQNSPRQLLSMPCAHSVQYPPLKRATLPASNEMGIVTPINLLFSLPRTILRNLSTAQHLLRSRNCDAHCNDVSAHGSDRTRQLQATL